MKIPLILLYITLLTGGINAQETRVIKGRVISENLEPIPNAAIYKMDTTILGSTNVEGFFNIEVPKETNEMLLGFVAMEWTTIKVSDTCSYLEVIMMHCVIYDYITI